METSNLTEFYTDDNKSEHFRSNYQTILAALFLLLTIIFGLLGNLAVIAVVCMQRTMRRETSNLLIINLCFTDLSNTVFVMSSAFIALVSDEWTMGKLWCDCICAINYCLIIVSMLTLCCISLDRYQAVMYPLSYRVKIKRKHMIIVIIYTWIQGITFGLAPSVSGWVAFDYWEAICAIQWHLHQPDSLIYVVLAFLFCFLIPGIVLVHCYIKILKEVKKQKYQVKLHVAGDSKTNERNKRKVSERSKIVWSLLVVVLAYFICTTPFSVTKLIKVIVNNKDFIPGPINLTASLLGYVASAINPLIYGIFRRDFRTAYKHLVYSVFLGRKYPTGLDTNSGSMIGTITNANNITNQEANNITGLESALNELQYSQQLSKQKGKEQSPRTVRFVNSNGNTKTKEPEPNDVITDQMETETFAKQFNKMHNEYEENREITDATKEKNKLENDVDRNIEKGRPGSITSCIQIHVKSASPN